MILNWKTTKEEYDLIYGIAQRASELARRVGQEMSVRDVMMDVTAAHLNGNPLRLRELLIDADDANFTHDVWGIAHHIDRETGQLTDGGIFNPRYRAERTN
jgi:hypothetical protein